MHGYQYLCNRPQASKFRINHTILCFKYPFRSNTSPKKKQIKNYMVKFRYKELYDYMIESNCISKKPAIPLPLPIRKPITNAKTNFEKAVP